MSFWGIVNDVIERSDIILEVLDARFIDQTRNREIEDKVSNSGKKLIFVLNKCDLVDRSIVEAKKKELKPSVFVSSTKRLGTTMLLHMISKYSQGKKVIVGVLGYPNTGKSSVINALKGRSGASVSPESGHTKALQLIRVNKNIALLDTPGVYPYMEKDDAKHAMIASVDYSKIKDAEGAALEVVQAANGKVEEFYGVGKGSPEEVVGNVALKFGLLKKGGVPDLQRASRTILRDWQRGKIRA